MTTQVDLMEGRQLTPDIPIQDMRIALEAIAKYFEIEWLSASSKHPIQNLWKSFDVFSSQQLLWLGDSILLLSLRNEPWVRDAVKKMKLPDSSRAGTVFEVIGIAAIIRGCTSISPCPPGTETIDANGTLPDGTSIAFSLKSFGATSKEADFAKHSSAMLRELRNTAPKYGQTWFGFMSESTVFPRIADWNVLEGTLKKILRGQVPSNEFAPWSIVPLQRRAACSTQFTSHNFLVVAPHAENEAKNILDKLGEAARELDRYALANPSTLSILLIRLTENADLTFYQEHAQQYLDRAGAAIAGIFIVQMSISLQFEAETTSIVVSCATAWRPSANPVNLSLKFVTGLFSENGSRYVVASPNGLIAIPPGHVFLSRQIYEVTRAALSDLQGNGAISASGSFAPGQSSIPVLSIDGHEVAFSEKHPLPERLLLFT